jgi:transcriptional regulator with XRE-family HTH domain
MAETTPRHLSSDDVPSRGRDAEPLWRHVLGQQLRHRRIARGQTLFETAERAGISPQYLSEMERGIKEPSSEMIAAVAGALDSSLVDLATGVAEALRTPQAHVYIGPWSRAAYALAA